MEYSPQRRASRPAPKPTAATPARSVAQRAVLPFILAVLVALIATFTASLDGGGSQQLDAAVPAAPNPPSTIPDPLVLGHIDDIVVTNGSAVVSGWALSRDHDNSLNIEVMVDGVQRATATADLFRPDAAQAHGRGAAHGFQITVPVGPRGTRICVFTVPDGLLVACERAGGDDLAGVLITPTGVVTPIIETLPDGYRVFTPCAQAAVVSTGQVIDTVQVLLDPGHGGRESSTVAFNGLMEKNVNLDVALRVRDILGEAGYSVAMTRTNDITMPIPTRTEIANTLDPDIFVSIHHNGGARAYLGRPGTEIFYQHDDPAAKRLAGILYEDLFATALEFPVSWVGTYLDGATSRLHSSGGDFYGIHRRTPDVTSVITEWLWLSNPPEAALLARPEVLEAEAQAIARAIDRWYRTENQGSGFTPQFTDDFDSGGGGYAGCVDPFLE